MICKYSPRRIQQRDEEKSSHNFLHNIIVTFRLLCTEQQAQSSPPLLSTGKTSAPTPNTHSPSPHHCSAHHFLCSSLFFPSFVVFASSGDFMNSIDTTMLKLPTHSDVKLQFYSPLTHVFFLFALSAGKQQHFRTITHRWLYQLHDFRFRYHVGTYTAEETRIESWKMGFGSANWTASNTFAGNQLHNCVGHQDGEIALRQLYLIHVIVKRCLEQQQACSKSRQKQQQEHQRLHLEFAPTASEQKRNKGGAKRHRLQSHIAAHMEPSASAIAECKYVHCQQLR